MSIRAITFDFWGTLFRDANLEDRHLGRVDALVEIVGVTPEAADAALQVIYKEFARVHIYEQRTLDHHDGARLALAELGISLDASQSAALARRFAEAILIHPAYPIEGALEAVRAAAARVPVGLICDSGISPGAALTVLLERNEFTPHFRVLTFSDEVGVSKPRPVMFERTAAALGVAPSEILHIGDLEPTDIVGIHGVGGRVP